MMSYQLPHPPTHTHLKQVESFNRPHGKNETLRQSNGVCVVTAATKSHINCILHSKFFMCYTFMKTVIKFHDGEFGAVNNTT
jgi:hypothetical protein